MNTIKTFVQKFSNDWSMNMASMLTYSLITTIFPILAAILTIIGLILHFLPVANLNDVAGALSNVLPSGIVSPKQLLNGVEKATGPLAIVSIVGLIWGGSNLFTNVENVFSIIFRVKDRDFLQQRLMAIGMVIILAILLPLAFAASSLVTAGSSLFRSIFPGPLAIILTYIGPLVSIIILWVLFLAIYIIVPNVKVPYRDVWRGALAAAILFGLITLLFPTYIKVFLHGNAKYGATVLTILVLLAWMWFLAVILVVGAQINAVAMGIKPTRYDLARTFAEDYQEHQAAQGRPAQRRRSVPGPVKGVGRVSGSAATRAGRLLTAPLRWLALLGWMVARPFVRRDRRSVTIYNAAEREEERKHHTGRGGSPAA